MTLVQKPFSNVQLELLKLFATDMDDKDIQELKSMLAHFYAKKATDAADKAWVEKGLTNEIMDKWLNEDEQ